MFRHRSKKNTKPPGAAADPQPERGERVADRIERRLDARIEVGRQRWPIPWPSPKRRNGG